jgi:hypothetical protein
MRLTSVLLRRGGLASLLCGVTVLACNSASSSLALVPFEEDACGPCGGASTGPPPVPAEPDGGPCVTSVDCAGGLVCGYDPAGGCDAQGECVAQVAGPSGVPACGCDGSPVQYVAPGFTSVPVASPTSCGADSGAVDAGGSDAAADDGDTTSDGSDGSDGEASDGDLNDGEASDGDLNDGDVNEKD